LGGKQLWTEAAEAFFDIRIADIAMGSGHFLVAAVDRVERALSAVLSEAAGGDGRIGNIAGGRPGGVEKAWPGRHATDRGRAIAAPPDRAALYLWRGFEPTGS
jgi:hypothetical protein